MCGVLVLFAAPPSFLPSFPPLHTQPSNTTSHTQPSYTTSHIQSHNMSHTTSHTQQDIISHTTSHTQLTEPLTQHNITKQPRTHNLTSSHTQRTEPLQNTPSHTQLLTHISQHNITIQPLANNLSNTSSHTHNFSHTSRNTTSQYNLSHTTSHRSHTQPPLCAALAACQGVGCTPWRRLVTAVLPVAFACCVRQLLLAKGSDVRPGVALVSSGHRRSAGGIACCLRRLLLAKGSDVRPGVVWAPPLCRWHLRAVCGSCCLPRGRVYALASSGHRRSASSICVLCAALAAVKSRSAGSSCVAGVAVGCCQIALSR